jgi:diaminohydroxyphosphoribosylaminopyrimidine deaminase/5-amino-6-(5-phosphoribosylamino)uracil reductase
VHRIRHAVDAILVGIETVRRDDPRLTARPASLRGKDPLRLILDTRLTIPESARVLSLTSESDTIVVIGESPDDPTILEKRKRIEKGRVKILEARTKDGRIDLPHLLHLLGKMGITSLLIEGGSRVIGSALSSAIVDKIFFFFAPKILGGDDGAPICRGEGAERMDESIRVRDVSVRRFGEDILIEGYIG